jgi:hypothetical protein
VANDERSAGKAPADDVVAPGGNGNGRVGGHGSMGVVGGAYSAMTGRSATASPSAAKPAPAVPLVPPIRSSSTLPAAPASRSGAGLGAGVTSVTGVTGVAPVIDPPRRAEELPQAQPGAPSPPALVRTRPPARMRMARRPRIRKVNRVVRRIDAWSVFKIALVFWFVVFVILLVAGMLLWNLAETTGTITNVEGFIKDLFGLRTFEFDGGQILRSAWIIGLVLVVGGTACTITLTVPFNLISDLFGGVRVTVLEEEVLLRPPAREAAATTAAPAPVEELATNGRAHEARPVEPRPAKAPVPASRAGARPPRSTRPG